MDRLMLPVFLAFAVPFAPAAIAASSESGIAINAALDRWQALINEAALRFNVPEAWIRVVMQAESGGQTMLKGRPITSRAGAMGLMQVVPGTYEELRRAHDFGADPYNPRDNIFAGAAYLRAMYDRFGYPGLFAAYNAGPERYDEYLQHGRPLPAETRAYLATIAQPGPDLVPIPSVASGTRLFFALRTPANAASDSRKTLPPRTLFVPLTTVSNSQR